MIVSVQHKRVGGKLISAGVPSAGRMLLLSLSIKAANTDDPGFRRDRSRRYMYTDSVSHDSTSNY